MLGKCDCFRRDSFHENCDGHYSLLPHYDYSDACLLLLRLPTTVTITYLCFLTYFFSAALFLGNFLTNLNPLTFFSLILLPTLSFIRLASI